MDSQYPAGDIFYRQTLHSALNEITGMATLSLFFLGGIE